MSKLDPNVFSKDGLKTMQSIIASEAQQCISNQDLGEPVGACHISVWTSQTCYPNMTLKACTQLATRVGGVSSWDEGGSCEG
jgi:hypothetical protein